MHLRGPSRASAGATGWAVLHIGDLWLGRDTAGGAGRVSGPARWSPGRRSAQSRRGQLSQILRGAQDSQLRKPPHVVSYPGFPLLLVGHKGLTAARHPAARRPRRQ